MFDERHLNLTSAYARNSEYFIRTAIYPLAEIICKHIEQTIDEVLDKQLQWEVGKDNYVFSPDENGSWKWTKFDPNINEFVEPPPEEQKQVTELLAESLGVTQGNENQDEKPNSISTSASIKESTFDIPTPELKFEIDQETYLINSDEDGKINIAKLHKLTNQFLSVNTISQKDIEKFLAEYLADFLSSLQNRNQVFKQEAENFIAEYLAPFFLATTELSQLSKLNPSTKEISKNISETPAYIDLNHWQELVQESAIAPAIAELNFESLHIDPVEQEHQAWEYLMYSDKLERLNTGRLPTGMLHKYAHIEHGGWWCNSGVDPRCFANLQPGEKPTPKLWGCYKPNQPRESLDKPGKFIKYEHPPKTELSIFLLDVPDDIANKIYDKAGVDPSQGDGGTPSVADRTSGFWYCVWKHNLPVTITEGAKKAASLLSQGHAAIGLPGIYAGYRSKDELGNPISPTLHDELAVFATPGREIKICFDHETRLKTKRNINIATYRTGQLLEEQGVKVSVVTLPGPEKGVDDLIVAQGAEAFEQLSSEAVPLEEWHKNNQPPDLRLTISLKNGTVKTIYEQKGDGIVIVQPEVLFPQHPPIPTTATPNTEPQSGEQTTNPETQQLTQPVNKETGTTPPQNREPQSGNQTTTPEPQPEESTGIFGKVRRRSSSAENTSPNSHYGQSSSQSINNNWARREQVTLYKLTFKRRQLEARENLAIAGAALELVKKYGVESKTQETTNNLVYRADAFIIEKNGNQYSIHRRHDHQELMTFRADQWGKVWQLKVAQDKNQKTHILPIERQEFLLVADYLKSGKPLPSVDEDPRKIASILGSLSVDGTHNLLESFKQAEVLKILTHTLKSFGRDDLTLGNYRILYQKSTQDSTSVLIMLKTEQNGVTREAVRFELDRTDDGMTHQVKTMAITELELNKLRLLAQKLNIDKYAAAIDTSNPHATRDMELPLHPQIAKQWQQLENKKQSEQSNPQPATTSPQSPQQPATQQHRPKYNPSNTNTREDILLPLHSQLAQYWQQLEQDNSWADIAKHGHTQLQQKIQQTGKLTISEQRELYQKIQIQAWYEMQQHGRTTIELPRLADLMKNLRQQLHQQPNSQHQTDSSNSIRNILLPLHPEIAQQWQDLETNHTWSSVADQWNHPLREKLQRTGKLTIGEQRELYQKILLQSQVEQHHQGKTDISLPPLNQILEDLMDERRKVVDNTYTPQANVRQEHDQKGKSNASQIEL